MNYKRFASESVASGHPDKICDQISDTILDAILAEDKDGRVAVNCMIKGSQLVIGGEVTTTAMVDYASLANGVLTDLGYKDPGQSFAEENDIDLMIHRQSPNIAAGVDQGGAGDQGIMYGYACRETPELMPMPITLAHNIMHRLDELRTNKTLSYLKPDGKCEVVLRYEKDKPVDVDAIVMAVPHNESITQESLKLDLFQHILEPLLNKYSLEADSKRFILNGAGPWIINGPVADSGLTGRKILVDTYGSMGRHGGGAFSGKDPTKVDRSAAYAARYIAKNIVAAGMANRCEIQLVYVIGYKDPIAKGIDLFGTGREDPAKIDSFAWDLLDLSVSGIINFFDLKRPIYRPTSCYGHFGRSEFPWEKLVSDV
jgi:S-adenosylmethionine synthetase